MKETKSKDAFRCEKILLELINYKQMIKSLVLSDLRTRYKGSVLGFLWTFLNPLLMLLVYTIVFSTIMRFDMPNYTIYMFIGLLPWMNFSSSILSSSSVIIRNSNLIKKYIFHMKSFLYLLSLVGLLIIFSD